MVKWESKTKGRQPSYRLEFSHAGKTLGASTEHMPQGYSSQGSRELGSLSTNYHSSGDKRAGIITHPSSLSEIEGCSQGNYSLHFDLALAHKLKVFLWPEKKLKNINCWQL